MFFSSLFQAHEHWYEVYVIFDIFKGYNDSRELPRLALVFFYKLHILSFFFLPLVFFLLARIFGTLLQKVVE